MGLFLPLDVLWPDDESIIEVGMAGAGAHAFIMCLAKRSETDGWVGRRGPDPWNPAWLLHICGFGNKNGGCHEWTSSTNVGRAASIAVAEQIAGAS